MLVCIANFCRLFCGSCSCVVAVLLVVSCLALILTNYGCLYSIRCLYFCTLCSHSGSYEFKILSLHIIMYHTILCIFHTYLIYVQCIVIAVDAMDLYRSM